MAIYDLVKLLPNIDYGSTDFMVNQVILRNVKIMDLFIQNLLKIKSDKNTFIPNVILNTVDNEKCVPTNKD